MCRILLIVYCYIPVFPLKCGKHLKETHKSVVKKIAKAMAKPAEKLGTAQTKSKPCYPSTLATRALGLGGRG